MSQYDYQPTMVLRWVEREVDDPRAILTHFPVLQQLWTNGYGKSEWRDISVEVE